MAFSKKNFVDNQTVIDAATLNAIQDELIRVAGLLGKDIAVAIPAVVRVLTGSEFNIYYANVISQQNAMFWCSAANGLTTKRYGDHLSITANAPGTYPLQWKVYDSGYSLLASGTCTIIAAANKAVTASALVIGDSTVTQGNYICQKLLSCFSAAGGALTLLGTRGTAPARHEGRAGWKASDYCTKAADGTYTNPFYLGGCDNRVSGYHGELHPEL